jgi:hypothetical protein
MRKIYRAILQLYPPEYRALFAAEMTQTFDQAALYHRKRGPGAFPRFAATELTGLLSGLATEWVARWTAQGRYMSSSLEPVNDSNLPPNIVVTQRQLRRVLSCMEFAIAHHDFPKARLCSDEERIIRKELDRLLAEDKLSSSPPANSNA